MDAKKIGIFLRELRKEKGLTQEQLAEVLNVSGRTVSRWETGTNMPDLSVLIQIAEFYEVEVKEILDGERKGEIMDKELKETLSKVADYNSLEKEKVLKIGNTAFGFTFAVCVAMIVVQLLITGNLSLVAGETAILLAGGYLLSGSYDLSWTLGKRLKIKKYSIYRWGNQYHLCRCFFGAAGCCLFETGSVRDKNSSGSCGVFCRNFSDRIWGIKDYGLSQSKEKK